MATHVGIIWELPGYQTLRLIIFLVEVILQQRLLPPFGQLLGPYLITCYDSEPLVPKGKGSL